MGNDRPVIAHLRLCTVVRDLLECPLSEAPMPFKIRSYILFPVKGVRD